MTLDEVYRNSLKKLKNPDNEEINVRILLCYINSLNSMSEFYIRKNEEIKDLQGFNSKFARFLNGEPIQYILQNSTFFGIDFYVDKRVLIPRQESEEVVEKALKKTKELFPNKEVSIADICAGSGCLGISLCKNLNYKKIIFSDISIDALDVCKINCKKEKINAIFYCDNALDSLIKNKEKVDVLIANPPYILNKEEIDESAFKYEPHLALLADEELSVYQQIISGLSKVLNEKYLVCFEIGYDIKNQIRMLIEKYLPQSKYEILKDINKKDRIVLIYCE